MNCRDRQHDIVLFLYDELSEADQSDLRRHLEDCESCREFAENERQIHSSLAGDFSEWKMPSDLLVECRRNLSDTLDRLDARSAWWRLPSQLFRVRWLEAAALVSIGLALGVYVTNPEANSPEPAASESVLQPDATMSNLRVVEADPVSGEIELAGDVVSPVRLQGNLEDAEILQTIVSGLGSPTNAGERLRLVTFLTPSARDPIVQEALIGTLLHDENPGVRFYALQALKPFASDEEVRAALLYVLENDDIPGIRVASIDALAPLTEDEATAEVVQEVTRADPNTYIRNRALQYVVGK